MPDPSFGPPPPAPPPPLTAAPRPRSQSSLFHRSRAHLRAPRKPYPASYPASPRHPTADRPRIEERPRSPSLDRDRQAEHAVGCGERLQSAGRQGDGARPTAAGRDRRRRRHPGRRADYPDSSNPPTSMVATAARRPARPWEVRGLMEAPSRPCRLQRSYRPQSRAYFSESAQCLGRCVEYRAVKGPGTGGPRSDPNGARPMAFSSASHSLAQCSSWCRARNTALGSPVKPRAWP